MSMVLLLKLWVPQIPRWIQHCGPFSLTAQERQTVFLLVYSLPVEEMRVMAMMMMVVFFYRIPYRFSIQYFLPLQTVRRDTRKTKPYVVFFFQSYCWKKVISPNCGDYRDIHVAFFCFNFPGYPKDLEFSGTLHSGLACLLFQDRSKSALCLCSVISRNEILYYGGEENATTTLVCHLLGDFSLMSPVPEL